MSSPLSVASIEKLDGTNYHLWSSKMRMALAGAGLWRVVDGSEKRPDDDAGAAAAAGKTGGKDSSDVAAKQLEWDLKNDRALGAIGLQLANHVLHSIGVSTIRSAAALWAKLASMYGSRSGAGRFLMLRRFHQLRMEPGEDVLAYVGRVNALADEMAAAGNTVTDADIVTRMLLGLSDAFDPLVMSLDSLGAEQLTREFVVGRLMAEHMRQKERDDRAGGAAGSATALYAGRPSATPRTVICFGCRQPGHIRRNCPQLQAARDRKTQGSDKAAAAAVSPAEGDIFMFMARVSDTVSATGSTTAACSDEWLVDSGASRHMCNNRAAFTSYLPLREHNSVILGNGAVIDAIGIGTVDVRANVGGELKLVRLVNVLHVPQLAQNLVSVKSAANAGLRATFDREHCTLQDSTGKLVLSAVPRGDVYVVPGVAVGSDSDAAVVALAAKEGKSTMDELWHQRLGHIPTRSIAALRERVDGLGTAGNGHDTRFCVACVQGKMHAAAVPKGGATRASKPLELVHSDVVGPMRTESVQGHRYYTCFVDDKTRKTWVAPMRTKDEVMAKFVTFKALVEKQTGMQIKMLRSDNGGEYTSGAFEKYLAELGIVHQKSAPHTPQQDGVAERCNRTVMEMARTMLHHAKLPAEFWVDAVAAAVYIKNRCLHKAVAEATPEEAWSGKRPDLSHLRVFGCSAYVLVPSGDRGKLDAKCKRGVFVGYQHDAGQKAYRIYMADTKRYIVSRNVIFDETTFGVQQVGPAPNLAEVVQQLLAIEHAEAQRAPDAVPQVPRPAEQLQRDEPDDEGEHGADVDDPATDSYATAEESQSNADDADSDSSDEQPDVPTAAPPVISAVPAPATARRERRAPGEWWRATAARAPMEPASVAELEPQSLREALSRPDAEKWRAAVEEELDSVRRNQVFELAELPQGRRAIGCRFVFKIKQGPDGSVERYKARLVAKGFSQVEGVDFTETFAPVAKFSSIRAILAIAAALDLDVQQMDVKTAFLNGDLDEEIYMQQPPGTEQPGKEHLVWRLRKALYGLKQAPRMWYNKLDAMMSELQFERCESDHSVYVRRTATRGSIECIVAVYVDDLLIAGSTALVASVKAALAQRFEMKDLGSVHWLLGIEVKRSGGCFALSQSKYIGEVLQRFGMADAHPVCTPMDPSVHLSKDMEPSTEDERRAMASVPYRSAVGSIMYAMVGTRPDIAAAVGAVSRFMATPGQRHWTAVKRVLRYLKGTASWALHIGGASPGLVTLHGYCDADWAGDIDDRRSTTGYYFSLGSGSVTWNSKRQVTVALSSTEAEYMAVSSATRELVWLRRLLSELGVAQTVPTVLYGDNQGAIALAKNPVAHARTKHIDVQHHFIRQQVACDAVTLQYCPTAEMWADVLTKALPRDKHMVCVQALGLRA